MQFSYSFYFITTHVAPEYNWSYYISIQNVSILVLNKSFPITQKAAIKKMKMKASKEFYAELKVLTLVHHLNLVISLCVYY